MTPAELARLCIDAQVHNGPDAAVTLVLPGPVRGERARLWPGGPLAEILCESKDANGNRQRVVRVQAAVVLGALAKIAARKDGSFGT